MLDLIKYQLHYKYGIFIHYGRIFLGLCIPLLNHYLKNIITDANTLFIKNIYLLIRIVEPSMVLLAY